MTTVARRDPADKAKIDAIEKYFDINPAFELLLIRMGLPANRGHVVGLPSA